MKSYILFFITLFISISTFAQQGINYKGVLKDTNGNVLSGTFMNVQFTIHQSTETGTIVYQEDHNYTTDSNGLLIHNIGSEASPNVGVFTDIDWGANQHFLQVTIAYSGGTINFDATEFMAVPYALHASNVSGLEKITENDGTTDNTGWRLVGSIPENFGAIGAYALDLSISLDSSPDLGATGLGAFASGAGTTSSGALSVAMGSLTTASGNYSTALGYSTSASGINSTAIGSETIASEGNATATGYQTQALGNTSTAMGYKTTASAYDALATGSETFARSWGEASFGLFNTDYAPASTTDWSATDRLFVIGNGQSDVSRSNALTILKNGTITAPSFDLAEITDDKALVTKEYFDSNVPTIPSIPDAPSGLEQITEGTNTGWRLVGRTSENHGPIGDNAIDLSYNEGESTTHGAIGGYSLAAGLSSAATGAFSTALGAFTTASGSESTSFGYGTIASGNDSTSMGVWTSASGNQSTAMGDTTLAKSYVETTIGSYNTDYTANSTSAWNADDRLFVIGNGISLSNRSNAMTVLKNGTITAPSFSISEINVASSKALITKEYADFNYLKDGGNVVSNNVGVGRASSSSLFEVAHANSPPTTSDYTNALSIHNITTGGSWQLSTVNAGHLNLYKNGSYRGYFNQASGAYTQASDRRVKKDITPIDNGTLYKVLQLNPVSYLMKEQTDSKRNIGLISQEVQEIFPSITNYVEEHDLLTLSYTELIPILIKALQEQQNIINTQALENKQQNEAINSLIHRMNTLEAVNNQ